MPIANLTDRKIASLKPTKELVEWWDEKTPGFGIRISPKGKKTWFVMYRFAGLRRRLKFGRYPEVTLEKARQKARKTLADVIDGKDPAEIRKTDAATKKRERLEAKAFSRLADMYLEEYAKLNKRSWKEDERILNKLLKPEFGSLDVKEITRSHVRRFLRDMASTTKIQANRTHACLRKIFNWAIKEEIVEMNGNPASGIASPGGREKPKERALNNDEIKAVWVELENEPTPPKRALQLILLTGQRPGEIVELALEELNLSEGLWTIPGSRSKNGLANLVPLSDRAIRAIEEQQGALESQRQKRERRGQSINKSQFLFPSRHIGKTKPMTVYAIDQEAQRISHQLGIPGFAPHDLRRTCSTKLGEMLVPGHLIDRILNHKPAGITDRVYNRYDYLKEKREALDQWSARISMMASAPEPARTEKDK